jgi:hypothetical protein
LRKNARNFAQFLKIRDYFFWGAIFGHISALFPKNTQKSPVLSRMEGKISQIRAPRRFPLYESRQRELSKFNFLEKFFTFSKKGLDILKICGIIFVLQ